MTDIKKGDRVRVVFEDTVAHVTEDGVISLLNEEDHEDFYFHPDDKIVVSVEKIEPPVEVFKPGDVVREKNGGFLYAIGPRGYTQLSDGSHFVWDSCLGASHFTSREFERVVLG